MATGYRRRGAGYIDCVSASRCTAVDDLGRAVQVANAWSPRPTWTFRRIDGRSRLESVSCASRSFCAAVDDRGYATVTR